MPLFLLNQSKNRNDFDDVVFIQQNLNAIGPIRVASLKITHIFNRKTKFAYLFALQFFRCVFDYFLDFFKSGFHDMFTSQFVFDMIIIIQFLI